MHELFRVSPVKPIMQFPAPAASKSKEVSRAGANRWTSGTAIVLYVAALRMILYGFVGPNYGYFRDELYYLACGRHPAWGYVDQPPLIAWAAWLLEHTIGTSLYALRLLPALAHTAAIVLAGLLARELGGRRWAMFLAALATLFCPVALGLGHLFTMNAFDLVLWTALGYLVARIAAGGDQRIWLWVGALTGVSLLNKYAIAFWIAGLLAGLVLTPLRQSFRQRWFWMGCALAAIIALPNFLWQYRHHFPFLELMHNIRESGRDVWLSPPAFLKAQAEMIGYATGVLVIAALVFGFRRGGGKARALAWAFVIFVAEMILLHGKSYYVAPVYPMMFAMGAAGLEWATQRRAVAWLKPALAVAIVAISGIYAPMIVPILPVNTFLAYEHKMGIRQQKFENGREGKLPQIYADMFGWRRMTEQVARFYHSLPPDEQKKTAIFGNNYGEAAAIDFFGPKYGLPQAISGHQNYWIWGPRGYTGENIIVLGEGDPANMQHLCRSYAVVGNTDDPLSRPTEWKPIYYCHLKESLAELWPDLKHWN